MDLPVRETEEMQEYVMVQDDAYEPHDVHDQEAHFLAGNNEKTIVANHFSSEPTSTAAAQCGTAEAAAPSAGESEGSVDDDVEAVDGGLSLSDEGLAAEEVRVAEEPECKDWEGDDGTWQQHAVGVICKVGYMAAATGLGLAVVLLAGQQQTPHRVHGDRKAAKVSARRDGSLDQGMSIPRFEHAPPAIISFGGSEGGYRF